ncbi:hypothetical protein P3T18_002484 [Paraburkholderia sp. GAS199]|uniref:hypothetical protein n=1 Tax=Paraburkholderia sp. GAS199 TaxID=3035126 RepID=UPI003D214AF8
MRYLCATGQVSRKLCALFFSVAVFLLWTSLAAGAGFILLQLPDVWAMHSDEASSRYAIMSVTAYALIVGALFLVFAAGAIERLFDAMRALRILARHLPRVLERLSVESRRLPDSLNVTPDSSTFDPTLKNT